MRTNSESILAVTLPDATRKVTHDVSISASIHVSHDTHIELVSYGERADYMKFFFTLLTGKGTRLTRPLLLLAQVLREGGADPQSLNAAIRATVYQGAQGSPSAGAGAARSCW